MTNNINTKSRSNEFYKKFNVNRYIVTDNNISWDIEDTEYSKNVTSFTNQFVHDHSINFCNTHYTKDAWADPEINMINVICPESWSKFNQHNRTSYTGQYKIDYTFPFKSKVYGAPLYPGGRTGICGRGALGKWGPNTAADPIITRINKTTNQIEMIMITRSDVEQLAIPGGMVDPYEKAKTTALREIFEESFNKDITNLNEGDNKLQNLAVLFNNNAKLIYKGCVDDPRNTDNAWIETLVYHYHIENDELADIIESKLHAGSDAKAGSAKFVCIEPIPEMYSNHAYFVSLALNNLKTNDNESSDNESSDYKNEYLISDTKLSIIVIVYIIVIIIFMIMFNYNTFHNSLNMLLI